jgi:dolichol-phosphate mannosyltransferase
VGARGDRRGAALSEARAGAPPRYSLVVPVYNEGRNIAVFCRALAAAPPGYELLICHDFAADDTLPAIAALPEADRPGSIRPVLNTLGPGVRYAIEAGLRAARAPVVVVTMADVSDDLTGLEEMVSRVEAGADVVCASRYVAGGRQVGGPRFKSFLSRSAGVTLHWLSGLPTHDPTNSFKAYSREFLRRTPIESQAGFALAMELTVKAHFGGGRVEEVPATWTGRTKGESRFRLLAWLPHYLHWYLWALGRRWRGRARGASRSGSAG